MSGNYKFHKFIDVIFNHGIVPVARKFYGSGFRAGTVGSILKIYNAIVNSKRR